MSDSLRKYNKRKQRVRFSLRKKADAKVRISVYRSNKFVYVQAIDDSAGHTLASASSKNASTKGKFAISLDIAKSVGVELGKKMVERGVTVAYYDRGGYQYHGIVKALADGVREAGVKF